MLKPTMTIAAVSVILAACSGEPTAPPTREVRLVSGPHADVSTAGATQPGVPGAANCAGQTFAYFAQSGKNSGLDYRGIGGIAKDAELSVTEAKAIVEEYCAGE